jgi:hypothetical protein
MAAAREHHPERIGESHPGAIDHLGRRILEIESHNIFGDHLAEALGLLAGCGRLRVARLGRFCARILLRQRRQRHEGRRARAEKQPAIDRLHPLVHGAAPPSRIALPIC